MTAAEGNERLQKILAQAGIASRRAAETLIEDGRVQLNGKVVTELGTKANPFRDSIKVDGKPLRLAGPTRYVLLHKPTRVVTTVSDPQGRETVIDLLGRMRERLYPVGRLDYNSSGLVLLTNDGELALRLTHPRYGIRKVYLVKVKGTPTHETVERLARGVYLEEGKTAPAQVRLLDTREGKAWLEMILSEGRRREIRRMCLQVGHPVEKLRRVAIGPLRLGKLPPGSFRDLTEEELAKLRQAVGL